MKTFILTASLLFFSPAITTAAEPLEQARRGREFLASMIDTELDLLPEYRGSSVYWLYHDNYLAVKVLAKSHPELSQKIQTAIHQQGERHSGKIEILFHESNQPLPFRIYSLDEVKRIGKKIIRTERVTSEVMRGWQEYTNLRCLAAIALAKEKPDAARQNLDTALAMWDGTGFVDPAKEELQIYATYKLALAALAACELDRRNDLPEGLISRLRTLQNAAGGWITDYQQDGTPTGKANVETTCLAILALEAHANQQ